MNRRHTTGIRPLLTVLTSVAVLGACGGGGGDAASEAEWCADAEALDSLGDVTPESLKLYEDLAKSAPTAELRDAMNTILPAVQTFATVDFNNPEEVNSVVADLNTDENNAANAVLTGYLNDVCGMSDGSDGSSGDSGSAGDANDDIDFSAMLETIDQILPLYADGATSSGVSKNGLFPGSEIIVPFEVEGDGVAFCSALLDWVNTQTESPEVIIRVQVNGTDSVVRDFGGECLEV